MDSYVNSSTVYLKKNVKKTQIVRKAEDLLLYAFFAILISWKFTLAISIDSSIFN